MIVTKTEGPFSVTMLADQNTGQLSRVEITIAPSPENKGSEPARVNLTVEAYQILKRCLANAEESLAADPVSNDTRLVVGNDGCLYLAFPTSAESSIFLESLGLQYPLPLHSCGNFENAVKVMEAPRPFTPNSGQ